MSTFTSTGANNGVSSHGTYSVTKVGAEGTYASDLRIDDGRTSKTMNLVEYYPNDLSDWRKPVPCMLWISLGGFAFTYYTIQDTICNALASIGCPVFSLEMRVKGEDPYTPAYTNKNLTDSDMTNGINATDQDIARAIEYVKNNRVRTNSYVINPDQIFLIGNSAGGISSMLYPIRNASHGIKGSIASNVGFGLDGLAAGDTADLRAIATETDWTNNDPPCCAFLGGSDTTIGVTYVNSLDTKLDLDPTNNDVHYNAAVNHPSFDSWPNVTSVNGNGTITQYEAVYEFIDATINGDSKMSGNVSFT